MRRQRIVYVKIIAYVSWLYPIHHRRHDVITMSDITYSHSAPMMDDGTSHNTLLCKRQTKTITISLKTTLQSYWNRLTPSVGFE
jgi:hypothetical protein